MDELCQEENGPTNRVAPILNLCISEARQTTKFTCNLDKTMNCMLLRRIQWHLETIHQPDHRETLSSTPIHLVAIHVKKMFYTVSYVAALPGVERFCKRSQALRSVPEFLSNINFDSPVDAIVRLDTPNNIRALERSALSPLFSTCRWPAFPVNWGRLTDLHLLFTLMA